MVLGASLATTVACGDKDEDTASEEDEETTEEDEEETEETEEEEEEGCDGGTELQLTLCRLYRYAGFLRPFFVFAFCSFFL